MYNLRAICTPWHFEQLVKAVPAELKTALATPVMAELGREIAQRIHSTKRGEHPFEHSIFNEKRVSIGLLSALKENRIGLHQYITAQNYHFHREQTGIAPTFLSLSDKFARDMITRTTTDSAAKSLFAEMVGAAPSEQGCFIYPPLRKQNFTQILHSLGKNALMQDPLRQYCLLPTHSLVDAYSKIKFNGKQMEWFPTLGTLDRSDYREGKRPIRIPYESSDDYQGDEFYKHEIVQYWSASAYGEQVMRCSAKMAAYIGEFSKKFESEHASQLKDLEHKMVIDIFRPKLLQPAYLYRGNETGAELFWLFWSHTLISFLADKKRLASDLRESHFYREIAGKILFDPEWDELYEGLSLASSRLDKLRANSESPLVKDEYELVPKDRHPLALMNAAEIHVLSW